MIGKCLICQRPLNRSEDPMSVDCGGDCWGCVGEAEYSSGVGEPERSMIELEITSGLRTVAGEAPRNEKGAAG